MAAEFLKTHGIDLDAELSRIQNEPSATSTQPRSQTVTTPSTHGQRSTIITDASLPSTPPNTRWDITITPPLMTNITPHNSSLNPSTTPTTLIRARGALLIPSLYHPHIHLDKAFLLTHPRYTHLRVEKGGFEEAMKVTGDAKAEFSREDLLERGGRVVEESVAAGVGGVRGFVEVDAIVGTKCLEAGIELQQRADREGTCRIQLCAFAQLPLFSPSSGDEDGAIIRGLMRESATRPEVDVVGSTPYVEADREKGLRNVRWMVDLAWEFHVHLDFHLDYHLNEETEPLIWEVLDAIEEKINSEKKENDSKTEMRRKKTKTIALGHCTRLTLLPPASLSTLSTRISHLRTLSLNTLTPFRITLVALPTSDMLTMRSPHNSRATLNPISLIKEHNIPTCLGVNNIGNAFTPQGSCDPLSLACWGVGVYQAAREEDAETLLECVSSRARWGVGMDEEVLEEDREDGHVEGRMGLEVKVGDRADLVLFGAENEEWRTRKTVKEAVWSYDSGRGRRVWHGGILVSGGN